MEVFGDLRPFRSVVCGAIVRLFVVLPKTISKIRKDIILPNCIYMPTKRCKNGINGQNTRLKNGISG